MRWTSSSPASTATSGGSTCSSTTPGSATPSPPSTLSEERWQRMIDIHLGGTFRCSQAAYPLLARQGGAIVNVSSIAAILGAGEARRVQRRQGRDRRADPRPRDRVGAGRHPRQCRRPGRDRDRDPDGEHRARACSTRRVFATRVPLGRMGRAEEIADDGLLPRRDRHVRHRPGDRRRRRLHRLVRLVRRRERSRSASP